MVDFVAYLPRVVITEPGITSFAFVKENGKFLLYLSKDPEDNWFIYYPDNPKIVKYREFKNNDYLFNEIKCSFESINFTDEILPKNSIVYRGVYYTNNEGKNYILKENKCINELFNYVRYLKQGFIE